MRHALPSELESCSRPETARRSHARNEPISRFRGALPKGDLTPPNLPCIYVYMSNTGSLFYKKCRSIFVVKVF